MCSSHLAFTHHIVSYSHTSAYSCICTTHIYTHTHTHTHICTHTHTNTHTHTHTVTCAYMQTHTCTSLHVFSMPHPYDHIRLHLLGPPSELVLVAFNSTALQAGWLAPTGDPNDGSLLSYGAVCRSAEGSGVQYTLDIEEARGTLLTALSPYTHYHCCFVVLTSKAIGPSTCQFTTTSQDSRFLFFYFYIFCNRSLHNATIAGFAQFPTALQKTSP